MVYLFAMYVNTKMNQKLVVCILDIDVLIVQILQEKFAIKKIATNVLIKVLRRANTLNIGIMIKMH